MRSVEVRVVDACLALQGSCYTWRGKGSYLWTPAGLSLHGFGEQVFDCSGLVAEGIRLAGGPDLRAIWSAETFRQKCPAAADPWGFGVLRLYGAHDKATHIGISLGNGLVLEAAGGDQTTTSPIEARKRSLARVRVNFDGRRDFMSAVVMPQF